MAIRVNEKKPFGLRLRNAVLFWGIPFTVLDLLGFPLHPLGALLAGGAVVFVLATAVALLADGALLGIVRQLSKKPR